MAAIPLLEELAGGASSQILSQLSGFESHEAAKQIEETLGTRRFHASSPSIQPPPVSNCWMNSNI